MIVCFGILFTRHRCSNIQCKVCTVHRATSSAIFHTYTYIRKTFRLPFLYYNENTITNVIVGNIRDDGVAISLFAWRSPTTNEHFGANAQLCRVVECVHRLCSLTSYEHTRTRFSRDPTPLHYNSSNDAHKHILFTAPTIRPTEGFSTSV